MSEQSDGGALKPGMVVKGYRIERELGRGAMAVVYLTRQLDLDRPVALKVMSQEFASNKDYVRRFFNEVRTAAALSHPNIIQAYDAGVAFNNTYYFAMEYVEGESMLRRIERLGPIPIPDALNYAREIASALDYGWQKMRFRHGDIKPENFMVQKDGHVKLADFGLAMVKGHEYQGNEVMLTPHYAAPELIRGQRSSDDCLADIYAFGASLYHLLSGTTPYPGNDAREIMRCHLMEKLEPLHHRCPAIPRYLSEFVGEMMAKKPTERIQDWKMVLNGIEAVSEKLAAAGPAGGDRRIVLADRNPARRKPILPEDGDRRFLDQRRRQQARIYQQYRCRKASGAGTRLFLAAAFVLVAVSCVLMFLKVRERQARREDPAAAAARPRPEAAPAAGAAAGAGASARPEPAGAGTGKASSGVGALAAGRGAAAVPPAAAGAGGKGVAAVPEIRREARQKIAKAYDRSLESSLAAAMQFGKAEGAGGGSSGAVEEPRDFPPVDRLVLPDIRIGLPSDPDILKAFHFTELQILLRDLRYSFGESKDVEVIQRKAMEWQESHPGVQGTSRSVIQYISSKMGPLLESYPAHLMARQGELSKVRIPGGRQRSGWFRVLEIRLDGAVLEENFPKGRIRLPFKDWATLHGEGILRNLLVAAYRRDQDDDRALRLFNYFLLAGEYPECRVMINEAPKEYRKILAVILGTFTLNAPERKSLALFQEALAVRRQASRALLGRLLNVLQHQSTSVVRRNQKLIEAWQRECRPRVPNNAGAQLISEALRNCDTDPETALEQLLRSEGMYPGKYPEASIVQDVYAKALGPGEAGDPQALFANLPFRDYSPERSFHLRWTQAGAGGGAEDDAVRGFYRRFLRAEAGLDRRRFLETPFPEELGAPPWKIYWRYARAVYGVFGMRDEDAKAFKEIFVRDPGKAAEHGGLLMRYLLLCHRNSLYSADYNLNIYAFLKGLDPGKPISRRQQDFFKLSLAVKLECQPRGEVEQNFTDFFARFSGEGLQVPQANLRFRKAMEVFHRIMNRRKGEESGLLDTYLKRHPQASVEDVRLLLACCGRAFLGGGADASFLAWYGEVGRGADLLGGDVLYDFILRRVGHCLALGDVVSALGIVERGMEAPPVQLWAYFGRLQFLRAGLLELGRTHGGFLDAFCLLLQSEWAGERERKFIQVDSGHRVRIQSAGFGNYLCFWEDWLNSCLQVRKRIGGKRDFTTGKDSMKAEGVLMEGLERFFQVSATAKEASWAKES